MSLTKNITTFINEVSNKFNIDTDDLKEIWFSHKRKKVEKKYLLCLKKDNVKNLKREYKLEVINLKVKDTPFILFVELDGVSWFKTGKQEFCICKLESNIPLKKLKEKFKYIHPLNRSIKIYKNKAIKFYNEVKKNGEYNLKKTAEEWWDLCVKTLGDEVKETNGNITFLPIKSDPESTENFEELVEELLENDEIYYWKFTISKNFRDNNGIWNEDEEDTDIFLMFLDKYFGYDIDNEDGVIGVSIIDYLQINPKCKFDNYPKIQKVIDTYRRIII